MGHSSGQLVCHLWKCYADKWFVLGGQRFSLPEKPLGSHKKNCILLGVLFGVSSGQPPEQHGVAERVVFLKSVPFFWSDVSFLKCNKCFVFRWRHCSGTMHLMCVNNAHVIWSGWKLWWQYCYCHENWTVSMKMVEPCGELESKLLAGLLTCLCSLLLFDLQCYGCSLQVCPKRCELSTVMNLLSCKGCGMLWSSQQINNPAQVAAE